MGGKIKWKQESLLSIGYKIWKLKIVYYLSKSLIIIRMQAANFNVNLIELIWITTFKDSNRCIICQCLKHSVFILTVV